MADEIKPDPLEAGTPERPDWLPERYETPEQFAKAYSEAERKITELSERAKQADALEENYNELAVRLEQVEQQRTQQQNGNQAAPLIAAYEEAYQNGDAAKMLAINAEISRLAVQEGLATALPQLDKRLGTLADSQANEISAYAARTLEQRYGDQWNEAKGVMGEILSSKPWLIPEAAQTDPVAAIDALDNVYKLATYGTAPVPQDDGAAERAKLLAQTATGAGTRILSPDEQQAEWDKIKAAAPKTYY